VNESILLSITIYGMAIVIAFLVAALIKGIVVALPLLRRREAARPQPAEPAAGVIPASHIAAITAAVATVVGPRHIIHIEDLGRRSTWAGEGRMMHQTSHAVPRRPRG